MVAVGNEEHPGRAEPRRPVDLRNVVELRLCDWSVVRAQILDEAGGTLGLEAEGPDARVLLGHRGCCTGRTLAIRLRDADGALRDVPARFVHATETPSGCRIGLGIVASSLSAAEAQVLLELWDRLRRRG